MNKNIELPLEVFNRLAKHAGGFDTPADVIVRLLDFYDVEPKDQKKTRVDGDIVEQAFGLNFNVVPRPFGQKLDPTHGFSDDNNGVQWNVAVNKKTGKVSLGVNLEGMKYQNKDKLKEWPITNLLLNEAKRAKLLSLTSISRAHDIQVKMTRDAWQAASRPPIAECNIAPEGLMLSELTQEIWTNIINESLGCLNEKQGYKGRGSQVISRIKSGDKKLMDVSPHLGFRITVTNDTPQSVDKFLDDLKAAQNILMPLYKFALERVA